MKDTFRLIPYTLEINTGIGDPISLEQGIPVTVPKPAIDYAKEYIRNLRLAAVSHFGGKFVKNPFAFAAAVVAVYEYQTAALEAYQNALEASGF